jgi:hypothetical protein
MGRVTVLPMYQHVHFLTCYYEMLALVKLHFVSALILQACKRFKLHTETC